MKIVKKGSTKQFCKPEERLDIDIPVKTNQNGEPIGNELAIAVYNDPESYQDDYEIIE